MNSGCTGRDIGGFYNSLQDECVQQHEQRRTQGAVRKRFNMLGVGWEAVLIYVLTIYLCIFVFKELRFGRQDVGAQTHGQTAGLLRQTRKIEEMRKTYHS